MVSTALLDLFGGNAAEAVLLALFHQGEAYGRSIARDFAVSLDAVQRQLDRLDPQTKEQLFAERRAKDKPVIRR